MNILTASARLRGLIAAATFSALACGFAVAGTAADRTETHSTIVRYGDLNVSNPQGADTLYNRIVAAAHEVCDSSGERAPRFQASERVCVHNAIADAVMKVGRDQLIAIYNAKNPQPLPLTLVAHR